MSAQPEHAPAGPPVPRTIRGVRRALDQEQRAAFEEELADAELGAVDDLLFLWWGIATCGHDPQVIADLRAADAGTLQSRPADPVSDEARGWSGRTGER
ncbi:hypothetical protein [Embleya sp. NPDC020630]|uniref:hypothetical protein n=1 Tax=Embleya sp. NPDC020630 TaxID=3363979 RepID=UPI0037B0C99E